MFQQVSYVNAICTIKGGTHVECVANQVIAKLLPVLKRKNKAEVRCGTIWYGWLGYSDFFFLYFAFTRKYMDDLRRTCV